MTATRAAALLAGLFGMLALAGCPTGSTGPSGTGSGALDVKVMSFNIRFGTAKDGADAWPYRRRLVVGLLERQDCDFVGMQEALGMQVRELRDALPQYHHVGPLQEGAGSHGQATPILYKHARWRAAESGTFWYSDTPAEPGSKSWGNRLPRVCTWARFVEKASGRAVYVFNSHLDHLSRRSRRKSTELLARRIADAVRDAPAVVTGDFNAVAADPAVAYLTGGPPAPVKLTDTYPSQAGRGKLTGTYHRFTGHGLFGKIDFIFVSPAAIVRSAEILRDHEAGRYPSDHFPLTAEVTFPR